MATRILHEMEFFEQLLLKTYVVGTQKNHLNEHPKQMFKLVDKIKIRKEDNLRTIPMKFGEKLSLKKSCE